MLTEETKQRALREFRRDIGKKGFRGTNLAINLNLTIRIWLARFDRRERYQIDSRAPHEVMSLIDYIETNLRRSWSQKSVVTRQKNRARQKQTERNARQGILNL